MAKCRWCGMESSDDYTCEWCKMEIKPRPPSIVDPFVHAAAPTTDPILLPTHQMPAGPPPGAPVDPAPPPASAPPAAPPTATPTPGTGSSRLPSYMAQPVQRTYAGPTEEPFGFRLERFLAIGMPMLLVATLAVSFMRASMLQVLAIQFLFYTASGVALPATGVTGFFDDEYRDTVFAVIPTLFLGPLIGSLMYLIIAGGLAKLLNVDFSMSIFGMMAWVVVTAAVFTVAQLGIWSFEPRDFVTLAFRGGICACDLTAFGALGIWLGWVFGGFFRPLTKN